MKIKSAGSLSGRIKLLHVDDDDSQLTTMKLILSQLDSGFVIHSESNPLIALNKIQSESFDCIVTDYSMPEMDGLEFARRIRENYRTPIILYTGRGSEEVAERAFFIGIDDYIRKETNQPAQYQLLVKRIRDLVERRRMENLHLSIVEGTRDALSISVENSVVFANRSLAALLGVEEVKLLIGRNLMDWVVPSMRTRVENSIRSFSANEITSGLIEYDIQRSDGSKVSVETSVSFIHYNGSNAVLSFSRDVVERKEIEEARKKSEDKFTSLVNLAPDGIITMDFRGMITFVNPAFLQLTNHTKEEVMGKWFPKIGTARVNDIPSFLRTFASIAKGRVPPTTEFVYVKKDGTQGWGEAHVSLIRTDGKKKELLAILSDITERKKLQQQLEERSRQLKTEVEEKTKELLDSERMITAGRVAAQVGHDLRGPLNTIKNAVYIGERYPERLSQVFQIINKAVDSSTQLLDEMRTRTQEPALNLVDVDMNAFLEDVLSETAIPEHYKIKSQLMAETKVTIDVIKMKRVLDNLFRNAVDAMPNGGIILISTYSDSESVCIDIRDHGCGIPDDVMKNLFKPFVTSKTNGTGLGLNFCKRVVEAHGGDIHIKSKVGDGTLCSISLPRTFSLEKMHAVNQARVDA